MNIEILSRDGKMKYFGEIITFHEPGQTEMQQLIKLRMGSRHVPSTRTHEHTLHTMRQTRTVESHT